MTVIGRTGIELAKSGRNLCIRTRNGNAIAIEFADLQEFVDAIADWQTPTQMLMTREVSSSLISMRIPCPGTVGDPPRPCGVLHIDEGEFATKLHHTHACQSCGHVWRPAIECTVGVQFLPGFKNK